MSSLKDLLNPLLHHSLEAPCRPAHGLLPASNPLTNRDVPPDFDSGSQNNILDELNTHSETPFTIQQNPHTWSSPSPSQDTQHHPHQIFPPPILLPPQSRAIPPMSNLLPTIKHDVCLNH